MTKEPQTAKPFANTSKDLSQAISQAVPREPGEMVRSVRVFDDRYRCNWWIDDHTPGPAYLNTGRIVKSKFFRATLVAEKLVLEDLSQAS